MAHINTAQLLYHATRVHQVQQDPAVQKAWSEAAESISRAVAETVAAWRRTDIAGGAGLFHRRA